MFRERAGSRPIAAFRRSGREASGGALSRSRHRVCAYPTIVKKEIILTSFHPNGAFADDTAVAMIRIGAASAGFSYRRT
jgi:hypothetical protein